ncbi:MAG TPA: UrcA family protein [Allosphingosinicella sp.]|nr:UrcA family protein [Allosphingosinicella sp.]
MKALAFAAAAAIALTAAPAAAADVPERVRIDDLELNQQSDISRLDARIDRAVRRLCASSADQAAARACRLQASSRAARTRDRLVARAFNNRPLGMTELEIN